MTVVKRNIIINNYIFTEMDMKKLFGAFICAVLLSSCTTAGENFIDELPTELEVSVGCITSDGFSRAVTDGSVGESVAKVQIYVFRENGDLDAYKEAGIKEEVKIKITAGNREFFAVANPKSEFKNITKKSQLMEMIAKLENEKPVAPTGDKENTGYTMVGNVALQDIKEAANIQITVERMVACIRMQYDVEFSGTLLNSKFIPDSIYVMNANSECSVAAIINNTPASTIISGGHAGDVSFLRDINDGTWNETPAPIGGKQYLTYFIYKNDVPKDKLVTSVVISGKISSLSDRQYYRIDINTPKSTVTGDESNRGKYIQNNVVYTLKATIKGTGTVDPTIDPIEIHTHVNVEEWSYINQDVEFEN